MILLQIFLSWSLGVYWTIIVLSQTWGKMLIKWQKAKWFLEKSCILISSIITSICFVNKLESSKRLKIIYIFFFFFFFHSWVRLCLECLEKKQTASAVLASSDQSVKWNKQLLADFFFYNHFADGWLLARYCIVNLFAESTAAFTLTFYR